VDATKGNGTTAGNSHPAETLTKCDVDFTSAPRLTATFPSRHNTVTAEVLSRLIKGETLTGMDAVFCANTTRLSAVIFYLTEDYGWSIEHLDREVGTKDGRVAQIRTYFLSSASIRRAFDSGAREFCCSVTEARAMLRKRGSKAKAQAVTRDIVRAVQRLNPNQTELFVGGVA
jgi:hypothetical protein